MTQIIPSSLNPRSRRSRFTFWPAALALLGSSLSFGFAAEPSTAPVTPPVVAVAVVTADTPAGDNSAPAPAAPDAATPPAAEDPAVTELRKQGLATIAALMATHPDPFAVDILIDGTAKLVDLIKIDAEHNLHYKQFGRSGQIAFADLTTTQVSGLLVALLAATGDEIELAPQAHLHAGLLFRVQGKDLESSSALAKAVELNPDFEPIVAERLKALPKPPPAPDAPAYSLPAAGDNGDPAQSQTTNPAFLPGGTLATDLSVPTTANTWPPKEPPIPAGKRRIPGLYAPVGPNTQPNYINELNINKPGVYENYLIDGKFAGHNLVNIHGDSVVFRNSEVRNSNFNGVQVYAKDVLIENCRIHHLASGSQKASLDAHGITGCPTRLVVRNCAIYQVSGDGLQFDPSRKPWTDVLIDHCEIWLEPLDIPIAGWKKGETPGENALDTKTDPKAKRARIIIRNSVFHGFVGQSETAGLRSALNLKENIDAVVENCVFYNNDVGLRLRGPGDHGGAKVTAKDCFFYNGTDAIRYEDKIQGMSLTNMAFANDIKNRYDKNSTAARDARITGDQVAPALSEMLPPKRR